ncbi:endopeptidase Clp ATP-dependent proteolytic subunit [Leptospira ryugenii]|uniref:Endopeptidase Clp ATP-dependent proteolytic subunit n=1 Tax=Leptospira ryugenii TaxID=1917863 RepID=A0A2P2DZ54_9LEPT|nr:AAA family ATPase [Leptospira ryugenii]GBF49903.1 endopeptidase Clp ATP-dependent proteolytic subunit [Leptospira ryugenii]
MKQFDSTVQGALDIAQTDAIRRKNPEISPLHLFLGLLSHPSSFSARALAKYRGSVDTLLSKLPRSTTDISFENLRTSGKLGQWITMASGRAAENGREEIKESDLLRYLPDILPELKVNIDDLQVKETDQEIPDFLLNLNEEAKAGKLDPVIGRTKEIRSVMEILGRRSKNNPVLVGSAGVGKTAIVEGLADQIVKGKVPDVLKGKTVYSLDMGQLMAGTKYRGDFEEKIQHLLKFVKSRAGEVILFIDEIHQLVGAGRTEGAMDAANLMKPALARGDLHCIGATTPEEFQKYILGDAALERRFRSVPVNEPSKEDAIEILMGIRDKHEIHHGIKISDEAVYSAVFLSDQYITDKNLPDKAIDLIDEAASALKLSAEAMPAPLVELESEIRSKKIYAQVEKKNEDILKEIEILEKKFNEGKAEWEKEVNSLKQMASIKNKIERVKFDLENAESRADYTEASRLKFAVLPELEKELGAFQNIWILGRPHVASVISRQTGIPVEKILKTKQENILDLENQLNQVVYGQKEAIKEIAETLLTSYAGISSENRPLGSFLLKGPTGVGKTETAKALAKYLFDSESNMVRLDLSEYSEKHSVAKLIGSPAGYVGYEEGGILTEAIRRKPYSVVLFDEIEKAHPDFADILLQILDDGRLTDNKGRTINFRNTIVLLTTNSKDIHSDFKPEVLGRLDSILTYASIDSSIMEKLIEKQVALLNERLKSKGIIIKLSESTERILSEQGYDPKFGARPLNQVFNRIVNRPLSKEILAGNIAEGTYLADWNENNLSFKLQKGSLEPNLS